MKKLSTLLVAFITIGSLSLNAQNKSDSYVDKDPDLNQFNPSPSYAKALWDIQFNYDVTTAASGDVGMAAALFFNNEFWVSRWASDTIYRFDASGVLISEFVISGLSGTRSFTTDGIYLYAGTSSNTIYRIDPSLQQLAPPHITSSASVTARFCTFDATLNAGAGGFWIGNFNTDIVAIDMTGNVLSTVLVTTHGLSGMYGAAVDNLTTGGPYLWVFNQGGANNMELTQLQLPSGTPTGLSHDVMSDVGTAQSLTSGLAGGAFISNEIVSGKVTLGGLAQGTPNNILFGYELTEPTPDADVAVADMRTVKGYTQIPLTHVALDSFEISVVNNSIITVDSIYLNVEVEHSSSVVFTDNIVLTNVASYATSTVYSQPYIPSNGVGVYNVKVVSSTNLSQPDVLPTNDTMTFVFEVTDSIYARDNGISTGSPYSVSSTSWGYAAASYQIETNDTLTGIWIQLETPIHNDTTYGIVASMSGGMPTSVIASTPVQLIDSMQNIYYMTFATGVPLTAGEYAFGCYEGTNTTINLAQSNNLFTPNVNFFYTSAGGWVASGIQTARFIHPVFGNVVLPTSIKELTESVISVYPNPTNDLVTILLANPQQNLSYNIVDLTGKIVLNDFLLSNKTTIDLTAMPSGVYVLNVSSNGEMIGKQLIMKK
jgi:hypothetical protein